MSRAPKKASEQFGLQLDVKAPAFRDLMTEQSHVPDGWATYYVGTSAQFAALGIPPRLMPVGEKRRNLQINGHRATLQRKADMIELSLYWGIPGPAHYDAGHPALAELARMIHCSISYWMDSGERDSHGVR